MDHKGPGWLLVTFPAMFATFLGTFPRDMWPWGCQEQGGGGRGTPHPSGAQGEANPARWAGPREKCGRICNAPVSIFHFSEHEVSSEWKTRNPNPPVSVLCLPRGSSNSSPWPSLLSFPLYNLLNSGISMATTACCGQDSTHSVFLLGADTQSRGCS